MIGPEGNIKAPEPGPEGVVAYVGPPSLNAILTESGSFILTESGDPILQE